MTRLKAKRSDNLYLLYVFSRNITLSSVYWHSARYQESLYKGVSVSKINMFPWHNVYLKQITFWTMNLKKPLWCLKKPGDRRDVCWESSSGAKQVFELGKLLLHTPASQTKCAQVRWSFWSLESNAASGKFIPRCWGNKGLWETV